MLPIKDNIPSYRKPLVNYFFIIANFFIFVYQTFILSSKESISFIQQFGFIPQRFILNFSSYYYTIFTCMFLHSNFAHFLGNMWFLYIFGDNVEDRFGHIRYFFIYLLCGIGGSILQLLLTPLSTIPMIGASGAISGILGAYFVLYPSAGIVTLVPFGFFFDIIVLPAVLFLGLWFIFQFFSGTASLAIQSALGKEIGGVAYWAHIGGFITGLIFALKNRRKKRRRRTYYRDL